MCQVNVRSCGRAIHARQSVSLQGAAGASRPGGEGQPERATPSTSRGLSRALAPGRAAGPVIGATCGEVALWAHLTSGRGVLPSSYPLGVSTR